MNNVVIPGLYSDTFSCAVYYKQDIRDVDSFFDVITYHLVNSCGDDFKFYVYANEIILHTKDYMWIQDISSTFSSIQKDLSVYIESPVSLSTGRLIPDMPHWEIIVRHGAIETKTKK